MKNHIAALCAAVILCGCESGNGDAVEPPRINASQVQSGDNPDLPAYKIAGTGPLVVMLGTTVDATLFDRGVNSGVPDYLVFGGYSVLALDLPCHGVYAPPGGNNPLTCWRQTIERGDRDYFLRWCSRLSDILDYLGTRSVAVVGGSRGAYLAVTCAAGDSRMKNLVLLAPLIDLARLEEFQGSSIDESVYGLSQYVPTIKDRNVLVRVSRNDARVGTDLAVQFANDVNASLNVLELDGHLAPEDGSSVAWLLNHPY